MSHSELTPEEVAALTAPKPKGQFSRSHVDAIALRNPDFGKWLLEFRQAPSFENLSGKYVTWHNGPTNLNCLSRRCGAPTVYKVRGVPLCGVHALIRLAEMLDDHDGYVNDNGFKNEWGDDVT